MPTQPAGRSGAVDALLNTLSPFQVAESIRAFAMSLSPERVALVVSSALPNLDGFERAQLAIAFGAPHSNSAGSTFDEPSIDDDDVLAAVRAAGTSAPERLAQFLVQNVRSLHALDDQSLAAVMRPVSRGTVRFEPLSASKSARKPFPRNNAIAAAAVIVIAALAFAGGSISRRAQDAAATQDVQSVAALPVQTPQPIMPKPQPTRAPVKAPATTAPPTAVPQTSMPSPDAAATAPATAAATPTNPPTPTSTASAIPSAAPSPAATARFEDRATNAVLYYLRSTQQRNSQFTVLRSEFDGRAARVVVTINGPDGQFLGEYTVLQHGTRMDIVDQSVTPQ